MEYLENRFIAMFDILGMSRKLCSKQDIVDTLELYTQVMKYVKKSAVSESSLDNRPDLAWHLIDRVLFVFDNIIIVSKSDSVKDFSGFLGYISDIMSNFSLNGMPLRGAIAHGDFCVDDTSNVFLSDVFKTLSLHESNQDWSGCIVLKQCEERILKLLEYEKRSTSKHSSGLLTYNPPLKNGSSDEYLCVNWISSFSKTKLEKVIGFMDGDENKKTNTEKFIEYYKSLPAIHSELPESYLPAVTATVTYWGNAASFFYWDADGERAEPSVKHIACNPTVDEKFEFYEETA